MYDGRFAKAKNFQGRPYRAENGNMLEYCCHSYHIYPEFRTEEEYFIGLISEPHKILGGFRGVCYFCGDVIHISRENIFETQEKMDEEFKERIEEIEGKQKCIKKSAKKSRK